MDEKPKPYHEYKEPYAYLSSITLAALGTIPSLAIWAYAASKGGFNVYLLALLVLMVFFGARFRQPQKQYISLVIAILISVLAMLVGDVIESTLIYGYALDVEGYFSAMMAKYEGFRILQYLIALGLAPFSEFALRRARARGEVR